MQEYTITDSSVQFSVFFLFVGRIYVTFYSHDKNINRRPIQTEWSDRNMFFPFFLPGSHYGALAVLISLCRPGYPGAHRDPLELKVSAATPCGMERQKHIFTVYVPDYIVTSRSSALSLLTLTQWKLTSLFLNSISP